MAVNDAVDQQTPKPPIKGSKPARARMSPEAQITARLKRSGQDFLGARKEFASASAQYDSMNAENIARSKAMMQYKPGKFREPEPPLPKKQKKYYPSKETA